MISQIAVCAILQTIALPTELPRRDPHFTWEIHALGPIELEQWFLANQMQLDRHGRGNRPRRRRDHRSPLCWRKLKTIALQVRKRQRLVARRGKKYPEAMTPVVNASDTS
jgi:hypothetical protein